MDRNREPAPSRNNKNKSLSARRAWIEICTAETDITLIGRSLSARRAWIEIAVQELIPLTDPAVALRKESVDRNYPPVEPIEVGENVALRKESVDRNYKERPGQKGRPKSLSARRAWIEMLWQFGRAFWPGVALRKESVDRNRNWGTDAGIAAVALRKESVDRNLGDRAVHQVNEQSLSARRAWIEMPDRCRHT